ncbi:MAG: CBS domain-containing protein [Candidatus Micrarchaeota archaeon]
MPNVSTIMQRYAVAVSEETSIANAAKLMKANKVSLMPVLKDKRLVGIVREKDLDSWKGDKKEKVSNIMEKPIFVLPTDEIDQVSKIMLKRHITRVPVVNNEKELIFLGIVTSSDVANAIKIGI